MMCEKCNDRNVVGGVGKGKCSICDGIVYSPKSPEYLICDRCSWTKKVCQTCGKKI